MSQWTHLAGIIRLDSMGFAMVRGPAEKKLEKLNDALKKALGNTCDFESNSESWDLCNVPRGSEGSLQYIIARNTDKDEHALSWGNVIIWGDLRDFGSDDVPGVVDWFQKSLERLREPEGHKDPAEMSTPEKMDYALSAFMIRDAVLCVAVEYSPKIVLLWNNNSKKVYSLQGEKDDS